MKTYTQFESELTTTQKAEAQALFDSVYVPGELMCASSRPTDAAHFQPVPISPEELAELERD